MFTIFDKLQRCSVALNPQVDSPWSWFITLSCFLAHTVTFGITYAFGIFYVVLLEDFPGQESQAAWIVSINLSAVMILSPLTISLCRRFTPRVVCCCGVLLASVAFYLASMATNMYMLCLTFGVMYGAASNFIYLPTLLVVKTNFKKHLAVAYSVGIGGTGVGAIVFSFIISSLVETHGWRGAMRVLIYPLLGLFVCGLILFPSEQEARPTHWKSKEASLSQKKSILARIRRSVSSSWRNKAFVMSTAAFFLAFFVIPILYCHIVNFAIKQGLSSSNSKKLPLFLGVGSTVGRLTIGRISAIPGMNQLFLTQGILLVLCVSITLAPLASSTAPLIIFAVVFGGFDGAATVLLPIVVDYVSFDQAQALQSLGNLFAVLSVPYALGSPLAGWLFTITRSYDTVFFSCGAILFIASCSMSLAHFLVSLPGSTATAVDMQENTAGWSANYSTPNNILYLSNDGLMKSRMCSLPDLSAEIYSEPSNTADDRSLSSFPPLFSLKFTEHTKPVNQDLQTEVLEVKLLDEHLYTDLNDQISGLIRSEHSTSSSSTTTRRHASGVENVKFGRSVDLKEVDNACVSFKDRMIDMSSEDIACDSVKDGCVNISIDDPGYVSAISSYG